MSLAWNMLGDCLDEEEAGGVVELLRGGGGGGIDPLFNLLEIFSFQVFYFDLAHL